MKKIQISLNWKYNLISLESGYIPKHVNLTSAIRGIKVVDQACLNRHTLRTRILKPSINASKASPVYLCLH